MYDAQDEKKRPINRQHALFHAFLGILKHEIKRFDFNLDLYCLPVHFVKKLFVNESIKRWFSPNRSISRRKPPANMIFAFWTYCNRPIKSEKKCIRRYSLTSQENIGLRHSYQFEMISTRIYEFFDKLYFQNRMKYSDYWNRDSFEAQNS